MKLFSLLAFFMIACASAININDGSRLVVTERPHLKGTRSMTDAATYYYTTQTEDEAVVDDGADDDNSSDDDLSLTEKLKKYQAQLQQYQAQLSTYQTQLMEYETQFTDNVNDNYLPEGYYISANEMLYVLGAALFSIILVIIYLCIGPSKSAKQQYRRNNYGYSS